MSCLLGYLFTINIYTSPLEIIPVNDIIAEKRLGFWSRGQRGRFILYVRTSEDPKEFDFVINITTWCEFYFERVGR